MVTAYVRCYHAYGLSSIANGYVCGTDEEIWLMPLIVFSTCPTHAPCHTRCSLPPNLSTLLPCYTPAQYEWLVREKVADGSLIAKWRKPGYEILCSMLAIQKGNHNFGTTSHCRVPLRARAKQQRITPDVQTGCISCASGDGK